MQYHVFGVLALVFADYHVSSPRGIYWAWEIQDGLFVLSTEKTGTAMARNPSCYRSSPVYLAQSFLQHDWPMRVNPFMRGLTSPEQFQIKVGLYSEVSQCHFCFKLLVREEPPRFNKERNYTGHEKQETWFIEVLGATGRTHLWN